VIRQEVYAIGYASSGLRTASENSPSPLGEMCRRVPLGEAGISYGLGLYRVKLDGGLGELIGKEPTIAGAIETPVGILGPHCSSGRTAFDPVGR
jgi:hypothetical protein